MKVLALDHVQLAMPPGEEDRARSFYAGILGIPEVPKPPSLAARGGVWFEDGTVRIHLGVEADFRPARKAHPALVVLELQSLVDVLREREFDVVQDDLLEGVFRVYVSDPFGNRIELIELGKNP